MKPARVLLVIFGALLALAVVAVGLALTPAVQRWAVLRYARQVPGLQLELTAVSGGFSGLSLQGVRAEKQKVQVSLERLDVDFSLWSLLFSRELAISRLHATGLQVDASRLSRARAEAAAAAAPAAAPGLLARVELPLDLTLDAVRLEGRALLPGKDATHPLSAEYTVTGGKFTAGQEGSLQLNATLHTAEAGAKLQTLRTQIDLRATLTPRRNFSHVSLSGLVEAEGTGLSGASQLKLGVELFRTTGGENYEVAVSTLLQGRQENALTVHAQLPSGSRQYAGDWELKARKAQLEPFLLGAVLPEFEAKGGGRFTFDPYALNFDLSGGLQGVVSRLETLVPAWRAFGELKVDTTFDLSQQEGTLQINRFRILFSGAKPVLEASTNAPLLYDLRQHRLQPKGPGTDSLLQVDLPGLPVDWIRPFLREADLSGGLITGRFDLVRPTDPQADASFKGRLQASDLALVRAGRPLLMKAALAAQLEATLSGGALTAPVLNLQVTTPDGDAFDLQSHLNLAAGPEALLTVAGRFTGVSNRFLERWLPGAPVKALGDFDLGVQGGVLFVRPGQLELRQNAGRPLLSVSLKQAFTYAFASQAVTPQDASQPLARLELGRWPLALLPLSQPETIFGGVVTQGDFEVSAAAGGLQVRSLAPLRFSEVSMTEKKTVQLSGLVIEALPLLDYVRAAGWKVQTGDVTVRNAAKDLLLRCKGDFAQNATQDLQASLTFTLEVPALGSQPLFAGARGVVAGRASGEIRAVAGAHTQVEARLTLNGLIAADSGQTLPVANLSFRGLVQPNGAVSIQAPLLLDNAGNRTDLNFALELSPLGPGYSVDGRLSGQHVELQDFLGVLGVFSAAAAPDNGDRPVTAANVPPDTVSAWSRFSGQLKLDIKSVTRGQDWAMHDLAGSLAIVPTQLSLAKLEATFSETSRLTAKFELGFTGGPMPYRLVGDYKLNDFDAGRLFKALEPTKPPTVEGLFTVAGRVTGNGETPGRALERMEGEFSLTSRQGVFRGLQRTSNKVSMTSKAVELGATVLGSIFGSEKVTRTAEKVAGQAYFVDQLAQSVGEFNYDLLSVRLVRDERLNMTLQDISLISPDIRLTGRGEVTYAPDQPLLNQPLNAVLVFAGRGKIEQLLGKLRLLDGTKDELGYARTREPITLGGTLEKPDPSAYFTRIATAKLADFLDPEN